MNNSRMAPLSLWRRLVSRFHSAPQPAIEAPDHYANGRDQARAQMSSIWGMVARLDHARQNGEIDGCGDYDDCGPDGADPCEISDADILDNSGWYGGTTDNPMTPTEDQWNKYHDAEEAEEYIHEDALSVDVRDSQWKTPGEAEYNNEFQILLCSGGPAVRIMGELDEYQEPRRAWLEFQDWGIPWTEYHGENASQETLLTYARQFYFGA